MRKYDEWQYPRDAEANYADGSIRTRQLIGLYKPADDPMEIARQSIAGMYALTGRAATRMEIAAMSDDEHEYSDMEVDELVDYQNRLVEARRKADEERRRRDDEYASENPVEGAIRMLRMFREYGGVQPKEQYIDGLETMFRHKYTPEEKRRILNAVDGA